MTLLQLSPELFSFVISFLSTRDLLHLAQCCQGLHALITPIAYKTIEWKWTQNLEGFPYPYTVGQSVVPLLGAIARRPELGYHIENIVFNGIYTFSQRITIWPPQRPVPIKSYKHLLRIRPWIAKFGLQPQKTWVCGLKMGDLGAYFALLLAFLPNLRTLSLGPYFVLHNTYLGALFKQTLRPPQKSPPRQSTRRSLPQYSHVSSVHLESSLWLGRSQLRSFECHRLYPIFYLPNIANLTIQVPSAGTFAWTVLETSPQLRSLKCLRLLHPGVSEVALGHILSNRPPIKELWYDYSWTKHEVFRGIFDDRFYNVKTLQSALERVQSTLTSLTLSFEFDPSVDAGYDCHTDEASRKSLLHFSDFTSLQYLKVPFNLLIGWERDKSEYSPHSLEAKLPNCLQKLELTDEMLSRLNEDSNTGKYWIETLQLLLETSSLGDLQSITIHFSALRKALRWTDEDTRDFSRMCEKHRLIAGLKEQTSHASMHKAPSITVHLPRQ